MDLIKQSFVFFGNLLWMAFGFWHYISFKKALANPFKIQKRLLLSYMKKNKETEFGRAFHFKKIRSVKDFQENIPITDYEFYKNYIEKIKIGEQKVLTAEPVKLLEPSSGTTSAIKLIPYTDTLKKEFHKALGAWIFNLFTQNVRTMKGKMYWSISPVTHLDATSSKVPIGFEDDSEYLHPLIKFFSLFFLIVPKEVRYIHDYDTFRYITLLFLLKEKNLTLISVWHPTFLILLLKPLKKYFPQLINDIYNGTITLPKTLDSEILRKLLIKMKPDIARANDLQKIYHEWAKEDNFSPFPKIWPLLFIISCWDDKRLPDSIKLLRNSFPNTEIQFKGLIATEGIVSFPFVEKIGNTLALASHFFEFIKLNEDKTPLSPPEIYLAHQLEKSKYYSVVITTGGGLYRYQLHDIVRVVGFEKKCPILDFIGKDNKVSDLFGEKLNEQYIAEALEGLFSHYNIFPDFYFLAPECNQKNNVYFYTLFLNLPKELLEGRDTLNGIADSLEQYLLRNFHYQHCRNIGQLQKVRLFLLEYGEQVTNVLEKYILSCTAHGQKIGDIKLAVLDTHLGWSEKFNGNFL